MCAKGNWHFSVIWMRKWKKKGYWLPRVIRVNVNMVCIGLVCSNRTKPHGYFHQILLINRTECWRFFPLRKFDFLFSFTSTSQQWNEDVAFCDHNNHHQVHQLSPQTEKNKIVSLLEVKVKVMHTIQIILYFSRNEFFFSTKNRSTSVASQIDAHTKLTNWLYFDLICFLFRPLHSFSDSFGSENVLVYK